MPWGPPSNRMFRIFLYLGMFYWLLPVAFTGLQLQIFFNSIVFGIATALLLTWGSAFWYAMHGDATAENQQIVATVTMWLIVWLQRLYSIIFVTFGQPHWLQNSFFPAFLAYMFGVTGMFLLVAPMFVNTQGNRSTYWLVWTSLAVGAMFAGVSYYFQVSGLDQ